MKKKNEWIKKIRKSRGKKLKYTDVLYLNNLL